MSVFQIIRSINPNIELTLKTAVARKCQMFNIIEKESEIIRNRGGGRALVGSAVFKTVSRALITFWVGSIPMRLRHFDFGRFFLKICALVPRL